MSSKKYKMFVLVMLIVLITNDGLNKTHIRGVTLALLQI